MEIELDLDKTVEQNANDYFQKAQSGKNKRQRIKKTLEEASGQLDKLERMKEKALESIEIEEDDEELSEEWYERFRWFFSSEGFLCIGGRDAKSNEEVVKKYAEKGDLVFHAEMSGSPFFVVKDGQDSGEDTIEEVSEATASYSKAWSKGLSSLEVFYVTPDQVSKEAQAGEYVPKGSFMIYGDTTHVNARLQIGVGVKDNGKIIGGAVNAVEEGSVNHVVLVPGSEKTSDVGKEISSFLDSDRLDDITFFIPGGGSEIIKKE